MVALVVVWEGEGRGGRASVLVGLLVRKDLEGEREEARGVQEECLPDWISSVVQVAPVCLSLLPGQLVS